MDKDLENILTKIDSRFSGPESCRLYDMLSGRLALDMNEIESYLNNLIDFGGIQGEEIVQRNQKDAKIYLEQFKEYKQTKLLKK